MRWTDIEVIIEALGENYLEEDIENLSLPRLHKHIISLLDFDDHPSASNEFILEAIKKK